MKRVIRVDFSPRARAFYFMKKERKEERKENRITAKNNVHMILKYGTYN